MAQVNLPPGFVLDEPSRLPPGFVIDKPEPEGYLANAWEAIKALPQAMIEGPVHEISAPSVRNFKQGIQAFRERDPVLGGLSVAASFPGAAYVADLSGKASQAIHDLRGGRLGSAANEAVQALPMGQTLKATQDRFYDRAVQEFARDPKSLIAADALGELHGNLAGFAAFEAAPKVAKATAKATRGRLPEIAAGATGFAIAGVPGVAAGVGAVEVLRAVKGYLKKSENVSGATAERMVREMPPERLLTVFEKAVDLPPAEIAQLFRSGRINDMGLTKAQKNALRARAGNTDTVPTNFEPQAPGTVEARLAKPAPVARTPEQRLEIVRAKYPQYDWEMGSDGNPVLRGRGSYPEQPATLPELPQVEPEAPVRGASPEIAPETPVGPPARPDPVPEAPRESMGGLTRAKMGYGVPQPPGGANAPWRGENPELGRLMLADRTAGLNEASTPARFDYGPRGGGRGEGTPAPSPIAEAYGIDTAAMLKQGIGDGAHPETGLPMKEVRNRQTGDITTRVLTRTEEDGLSWSHSPEWVMENAPDVIARHQARLKASEGRTSVPEVQRRLDEALRRDEPPPPGGVPNTNIDPALAGRKQRGRTKAQLDEQARRLAEPPVETGAKEALDAKIAENKTKGGDLAAVLAGEKPPVKPAALERAGKAIDEARKNPGETRSAADIARELSKMVRPRPLKKMFGSNGPTVEQMKAYDETVKAFNRKRSRLSREHKIALERDNAAFRAIRNGEKVNTVADIPKKAEAPRELILHHNLTADNVIYADRMGGLPVPSLAVSKAKSPMENFGEITLIGDEALADPKRSGIKIFSGDIYSPRYPTINYKLSAAGEKKLIDTMKPHVELTDLNFFDFDEVREKGAAGLRDDPRMMAAFLESKGIKVEKAKEADPYYRRLETKSALRKRIESDNLSQDFIEFSNELFRSAEPTERIFRGFTNMGNRRYIPHTLENVVNILKKDMKSGEGMNYGVPSIRAAVAPKFRSIEDVRKAGKRLVTKEAMEKVKEDINKEFWSIAESLPAHKDSFGHGDRVSSTMVDAAKMKNLDRALRENQFLGVTQADKMRIRDFMEKLKSLPSEYFEAKLTRPVGIEEFRVAVVPNGTNPKALKILEKKGLEIRTYDKNVPSDRAKVIQEATEAEGRRWD